MRGSVLRRYTQLMVLSAMGLGASAGWSKDLAERARLHYLQHCVGCHQTDGSGMPDNSVPSMRGALGRFLSVPGGREFIVQVPGVLHSPLRDHEIANLMNWLLPQVSAATLPPHTAPYTAAEIKRLREQRLHDIPGTRRALAQTLLTRGIDVDAPVTQHK
jgi:mono/diheme cytochrome c family protein